MYERKRQKVVIAPAFDQQHYTQWLYTGGKDVNSVADMEQKKPHAHAYGFS